MGSNRVRRGFLAGFFACLVLAGTTLAQQNESSDELAIRALMDRVNLAMTADTAEKGVDIMRGVVSDKGYAIVNPNPGKPTETLVGDKRVLLEILGQSLQSGPRWGVHKVQKIVVVGPVAYEMGESTAEGPDGKPQTSAWCNVFAKEDVGWKLVYTTPAAGFLRAVRQLGAPKKEPAR